MPGRLEAELPRKVLKNGFLLGLLVTVLGITLKYHQLNKAEQSHALNLIQTEINNNLTTIQQLSQNTQTLLDSHQTISNALRSGDSRIMKLLFPTTEQTADKATQLSQKVEKSFAVLKESNLLKNKTAMNVFNSNKNQINTALNLINQTLASMQDPAGEKYAIKTQIWQNHKEVIAQLDDFDMNAFENSLNSMHALKSQYNQALKDNSDYFFEVSNFAEHNTFVGNGIIFKIMSKEKQSLISLSKLNADIKTLLPQLKRQQQL